MVSLMTFTCLGHFAALFGVWIILTAGHDELCSKLVALGKLCISTVQVWFIYIRTFGIDCILFTQLDSKNLTINAVSNEKNTDSCSFTEIVLFSNHFFVSPIYIREGKKIHVLCVLSSKRWRIFVDSTAHWHTKIIYIKFYSYKGNFFILSVDP